LEARNGNLIMNIIIAIVSVATGAIGGYFFAKIDKLTKPK
jgi:hypothetical protein